MTTARGPGVPAIARDVRQELVHDAVVRLGLLGAAVIRIGPGEACTVVSSWPAEHLDMPTLEAATALRTLAASRRGVAAWRPGSRTFAELALLGGVAVAGRAALIAAIRISTPAARDPEVVVVISSEGDRDPDELARELARLNAPPIPEAALEVRADARMARLVDLGLRLAGELDVETLLAALVENARELFDAAYAAIGVLDPSGTTIERFRVGGMDAATQERIGPVPTGRGLLGALLEDPRPVRLARLTEDARSCGFPPHHPPMESFLGVPILLGGVVFGNLYMTEKRSGSFTR